MMLCEMIKNIRVARDVYAVTFKGEVEFSAPGQFVQVQIPGFYLRRPISVSDWSEAGFTLVYKVVGEGTRALSQMETGVMLDILSPLGNGFWMEEKAKYPLLVGGGMGVAPLYSLAKRLKNPTIVMGFQSAEDVFYKDEFEALGAKVIVYTVDGASGVKGFVTDAMGNLNYDYVYACGPEPMLKAVDAICLDGQFSFEERMACGFGACMGCSCQTKYGAKRICKDGPVLSKGEIIW